MGIVLSTVKRTVELGTCVVVIFTRVSTIMSLPIVLPSIGITNYLVPSIPTITRDYKIYPVATFIKHWLNDSIKMAIMFSIHTNIKTKNIYYYDQNGLYSHSMSEIEKISNKKCCEMCTYYIDGKCPDDNANPNYWSAALSSVGLTMVS